jgi:hypothetical protein
MRRVHYDGAEYRDDEADRAGEAEIACGYLRRRVGFAAEFRYVGVELLAQAAGQEGEDDGARAAERAWRRPWRRSGRRSQRLRYDGLEFYRPVPARWPPI